jgi:hypothetical protein
MDPNPFPVSLQVCARGKPYLLGRIFIMDVLRVHRLVKGLHPKPVCYKTSIKNALGEEKYQKLVSEANL